MQSVKTAPLQVNDLFMYITNVQSLQDVEADKGQNQEMLSKQEDNSSWDQANVINTQKNKPQIKDMADHDEPQRK